MCLARERPSARRQLAPKTNAGRRSTGHAASILSRADEKRLVGPISRHTASNKIKTKTKVCIKKAKERVFKKIKKRTLEASLDIACSLAINLAKKNNKRIKKKKKEGKNK